MSSAPARCLIASGVSVGDDRAVAHQQQPVAALGLVHHVAGDEHRGAGVGEPVEQRPEVAAQHRVEPDGRLVEDEQVRAAEQRDGEAGPRALAAAEPADHLVARGWPRSTASIARVDLGVAAPSTRAKKRRFSVTVRSSYTLAAWVT